MSCRASRQTMSFPSSHEPRSRYAQVSLVHRAPLSVVGSRKLTRVAIKDTYPSKQDSFSSRGHFTGPFCFYLFVPSCSTDSTRIYMLEVACGRCEPQCVHHTVLYEKFLIVVVIKPPFGLRSEICLSSDCLRYHRLGPGSSHTLVELQPSFSTLNTYYQPPPPQFGPHDPVKRMMLIPLNVARSVFIFRLPTGARDTHPELKNLGNGLPHVTSFAGGSRRGGRVWYRRPTMTPAQVYAVVTDCLDRV